MSNVRININGNDINLPIDQQPELDVNAGRVSVPLRGVFDHLGYIISWDGVQTITIANPRYTLTFVRGSTVYNIIDWVNPARGGTKTLDVAPYINEHGRTMLPLSGPLREVGFEVQWVGNTNGSGGTAYVTGHGERWGREFIIPEAVNGRVQRTGESVINKTVYPRGLWFAYQSRESVNPKNHEGRYRIVVGPRVINPSYLDTGRVRDGEGGLDLPVKIDAVIINRDNAAEIKVIRCVVERGTKAHTFIVIQIENSLI